MRFLFKALLAATALMPVAAIAHAQDAPRERSDDRRGQRGERGGDPRARGERGDDRPAMRQAPDRPQRIDVDRDMARGGDWNANRDGSPARGPGDGGGAQARTDARVALGQRGDPGNGRAPGVALGVRADAGAGWRDDRRRGDDARRDDRPAPGFLGARDGRSAYRNDGYRGGYVQQGRNDGWRNDDRGNDRRNWNPGWRSENRYDWNRYRTTNRSAYRLPRYYAPYGWTRGYRRLSVGVTLSGGLFGENYWIDDPYAYRLPEAYGPYRWVRYYNDALLVDVRYGRVVDVVADIFW